MNVDLKDVDCCQYLKWDSDFFGCRIARLLPGRLDRLIIERVNAWCNANAIDCLYFLSNSDDDVTRQLAVSNGFRLVDVKVTLELRIRNKYHFDQNREDIVFRASLSEDIPFLKAIARVGHHYTRFYFDKHFPAAACDALYETWIEKSCNGYADIVFVAEHSGLPVGYASCHLSPDGIGKIGLIAVASDFQKRGIGRLLVERALDWFCSKGSRKIVVVTQERNIGAQRLYEKCKFVPVNTEIWYHKWFHSKGRANYEE